MFDFESLNALIGTPELLTLGEQYGEFDRAGLTPFSGSY
jgi:hypothetical protein